MTAWPLDECGICGSCLCSGDPCQLYGRPSPSVYPLATPTVEDPDWPGGRPVPTSLT